MDGIELAAKLFIAEQRQDLRFILFSGTPLAKIAAALDETGLDIPVVPKTRLRESWTKSDTIGAWFPELAGNLPQQQK